MGGNKRKVRKEGKGVGLPTGPRIDETGGISCSAKRQTLPEGLPSIDPSLRCLLPLLSSCRVERRARAPRRERGEYLALYVSSAAAPLSTITRHCSREKPIAGNTSLRGDRKEGRKEGRRQGLARTMVTTST